MAEETTSTSGITGNARKSQESGVRLRDTTKKMTTIPRLLTLMVMVVIFFLIITYPMSLFWKVTSGIVILIAGIKLAGVKDDTLQKEIKWKFPLVLQGMGGVIIAIALANSGFINWADQGVTYLDTCARSECPESSTRQIPRQIALCGPNVFIERRVTSTTVPARFEGRPTCRKFIWDRPQGLPLLIRYNGEGGYQLWPSNGPPPRSERVIRFAEVKLVNPGEAYISVFFPR